MHVSLCIRPRNRAVTLPGISRLSFKAARGTSSTAWTLPLWNWGAAKLLHASGCEGPLQLSRRDLIRGLRADKGCTYALTQRTWVENPFLRSISGGSTHDCLRQRSPLTRAMRRKKPFGIHDPIPSSRSRLRRAGGRPGHSLRTTAQVAPGDLPPKERKVSRTPETNRRLGSSQAI